MRTERCEGPRALGALQMVGGGWSFSTCHGKALRVTRKEAV